MEFQTYGLVIREYPQKERDKLLTILTREHGKLAVWANNSRAQRSPLLPLSQTLSYSHMMIRERNGKYSLVSGTTERIFSGLREDIERLSLAQYFCELADAATVEVYESGEVLSLILNALHLLCREDADFELIKAVFELRFMSIIGYAPSIYECASCGAEESLLLFDIPQGRMLCKNCAPSSYNGAGVYGMNDASYDAMKHIISSDPKKIFSFRIDKDSLDVLSCAAEVFLLTHLGIAPKTLEFYKTLRSEEK